MSNKTGNYKKKLRTSTEVKKKIDAFVRQYVPKYVPTQKRAVVAIKKIIIAHDDWSRALGGIVLSLLQKKNQ